MEEQDLIGRSQKGDLEAFNQLVEQYQRLVFNVSLRMLGHKANAEDATQETFLSAYRSIGGFRGGNFKAWVVRIATNCCRDQLRTKMRTKAASLDALMDSPGGFDLADSDESPDDYASRQETGRVLKKALNSLQKDQRLVVVLFDTQGMTYEEIVQITGWSLGTVKSRLSRGRAHLRDFLVENKELLPPDFHLSK